MPHNNKIAIKKVLSGNFGTVLVLIFLMCIMTILTPKFFTVSNLTNILIQSATNAIIAVGMTFVIVSGNTDISVGAILAMSSCVGAQVMKSSGSIPLGLFASILAGCALGLFNGTLIAFLEFPPFIVTLSTMWLFRGLAYLFTEGRAIVGLPESMMNFANGKFVLPYIVWVMLIIYISCHFLLQKTVFGRKVVAVGDSKESARLSGINVKKITFIVFVMSGFFSAISGIVYMSRLNSGQPIAGQSYEMYAIAASVIGGASLTKGGIGNILGTLIGAIFIAVLQNGLIILNVSTYWQQVAMGIVVLLAIGLDKLRKRMS